MSDNPRALAELGEALVCGATGPRRGRVRPPAYGLAPDDPEIVAARRKLLDDLAVEEHGLVWRYVPGGTRMLGAPTATRTSDRSIRWRCPGSG